MRSGETFEALAILGPVIGVCQKNEEKILGCSFAQLGARRGRRGFQALVLQKLSFHWLRDLGAMRLSVVFAFERPSPLTVLESLGICM